MADLGGFTGRGADGQWLPVLRVARWQVRLGAVGVVAVDSPSVLLDDPAGLSREAAEAASAGFAVKACVHPRQVDTVRAAPRPDAGQVTWAREVLAAADLACSVDGTAVFMHLGQMIDAPRLRLAQGIVLGSGT